MLEICDLTKRFKENVALDGISCKIKTNTIVGLVGHDGAGKTTLLRIIANLMPFDSGSIKFNGEELSQESVHAITSYMPQKFGLYEDLTVIENLNLYSRLHMLPTDLVEESFNRVLTLTKLNNFRNRLAGNLSGGMKQKLALACTLLKQSAKILVLDEPSVGVDPISRRELIGMVVGSTHNCTVIWSTSYLDEAEEFDHVILLNNGKIIFNENPKKALKSMESKVFIIKIHGDKRSIAQSMLKSDANIIDSVIHGDSVRFVTSNETAPHNGSTRASPTFEDACISMMGGIVERESAVSTYMSGVNYEGNDKVVEAINLTKKFGNFVAADNISFTVGRGKILGLLGPNGSGKSTTFKILCGLLRQNSGSAKIVGIDIAEMGSNAKLNIGYMAQKFSLYSILSVRQNLEFFAGAYRLPKKARSESVELMLNIFHLKQFENMTTALLPLGFKQRLALACSIIHKPQVLFLDEPTSGVDPITRREFWMHINCMVNHGVSVIVTTHFMDEAENCDEIALIYQGKIRTIGTSEYLKSTYCANLVNPTLGQAFVQIIKNSETLY